MDNRDARLSKTRLILFGLILFSGFSALIYEIIWTRHLSLLFGSNMLAVGTVAATFMAGLAIGSLLFGKQADRSASPLRLYALLEIGIAATALLFPLTLKLVRLIFLELSQSFPGNSGLLGLYRIGLAAVALLPPTIFMGGTLPVVCRYLATQQLGKLVGKVYASNTFGAVIGCLLGGFLLIPHLGLFSTQTIAIVSNLVIAIWAWTLGVPAEPQTVEAVDVADATIQSIPFKLLLVGACLIGVSALAFEMLWTRFFLLYLGNTTYAFSTILSVYLLGLAVGGVFYARVLSKRPNQALVYILLLVGMLFFVLATLPFYDRLAYLFEMIHSNADGHWWALSIGSFFAVALLVLLPAVFSGALFPTTIALMQTKGYGAGQVTGQILFWNTIGAMIGSFVGVFAIKQFGLLNSFKFVALINVCFAIFFLVAYRARVKLLIIAIPLSLCLFLFIMPFRWDLGLMNSGIYYYSRAYLNKGGLGNPKAIVHPEEVVEGLETTAAFFRRMDGSKGFRVNGKTDGSTTHIDMRTQILSGQLPMLFKPDPEKVLVIGLGTGITLRQILDYPVKRVDCVEISPEVVAISRHFSEENEQVLADPRVRLLIGDGRNHLLTRDESYGVIISEPSNPWQAGNANLFTREFYALGSSRLSPGGIFCQWVPIYDLDRPHLKIAMRTFSESFPYVRIFLLGPDMVLLGSHDAQSLDLKLFDNLELSQSVRAHLAQIGLMSARKILRRFYFGNARLLREVSASAPLNTDNLPYLEFFHLTGRDPTQINLRFLFDVQRRLGQNALN